MTASKTSPQQTETTVLLFGDATETWVDGLDQLYKQAASTPWLRTFLDELTETFSHEARAANLDRTLQDNLGHFSTLLELSDRYRHSSEQFGLIRAILLHAVRAGNLLQWAKQEPGLIGPNGQTEMLGISGGLLTLSALTVSDDFDSLYNALLETGRLAFRVAKVASVRSRAIEDKAGTWGWAVLGISSDDLRKALRTYQDSIGIPFAKQAKVGVVGAGWSTVIGPPSVLDHVANQCPSLKNLPKNPLEIRALQHTLDSLTKDDLDYMVGIDSDLLQRPVARPNLKVWGMDNPDEEYNTFEDLFRLICSQVLASPLDITEIAENISAHCSAAQDIRLLQIGSCSHAPYLAGVLKESGKKVSIWDQTSLSEVGGAGQSLKSGRIAIVGASGRGPGSDNIDEFWDLIMSKRDVCSEVPKDRFDIDEYYCEAHERGDTRCRMAIRHGCFMDNPGHFDSRFFHISPREALLMDPNHRHFLMSSYEALENAGYSDGRTRDIDPDRIAAFFAQATDDWHKQTHPTLGCDSYTLQGIQRAFGAGRLAWQFKWEGPTYAFDSACAGTTAGIHLACQSLLSKDIDMAVSGAANILSWPHSFTCLDDSGILSATGNCKPFRDDADGYCRGDFTGAVVLKRLEDAVEHNDNILGVVAASGRNHSGNSTSITTSDAGAQERLFRKVLRNAQATPDDVGYVEMHGTGTQTGDPAEMGAVASTFSHRKRSQGPLYVGGVKGNVGHSEAAAGMAELLKCLKMFETDTIPPQAGMPHSLNPKFPALSDINVSIPSEPQVFKQHKEPGQPRRILLNNFDAAGGNACLLLEEYVPRAEKQSSVDGRSAHLVTTSARTKASFESNKQNLIKWLKSNPGAKLEDIAYTTTARRMQHPLRFAAAASSTEELIAKLESSKEPVSASSNAKVVFSFTGQGSHYAGMGAELYRTSPVFRETADLCAAICADNQFPTFLDLLKDESIDLSTKNTAQIQLAIVTLEVALTAFWRFVGLEPSMVIGHSLGEYAALHAAGVLSLADTLYLVGSRAIMLLERCEPDSCAMVAVMASEAAVKGYLQHMASSSCDIACVNSSNVTVVSGTNEDLEQFKASVKAQDGMLRMATLSVPFAFHSFQMDTILQAYNTLAGGVTYSPPNIPVASTLLGSAVDEPGVFGQDYLARQTRQQVNFVGALQAIDTKMKDPLWLELGPQPVCSSFVRSTLAPSTSKLAYSIDNKSSNWTTISEGLSLAYMNGLSVDWLKLHKPYAHSLSLIDLPLYQWDMKEFWLPYTDKRNEAAAEKPQQAAPSTPWVATTAQYLVSAVSSPKIQMTFRASISDPGFLGLIDGHKMQQIGLASGSVFCDAALMAACCVIDSTGRKGISARNLSIHDPELLAPLTRSLVGVDGDFFTTATMETPSTVRVTFRATSAKGASHDLGSIRVEVSDPDKTQKMWDRTSYFIKSKADERVQASKEGLGHVMKPEVIYALFANAVEFDPSFRGIQEAYMSEDFAEASALVTLKDDPAGTNFAFSPYWSEALAHLAGFMVNGNPSKNPRTTFIVMGFESVTQTADFEPGKTYQTYTRINRWEKSTAFCDAYVFEQKTSKCVMQAHDLRYQELPRTVWKNILEGGHSGAQESTPSKPKTVLRESKPHDPSSAIELSKAPVATKAPTVQEVQEESPDDGIFQTIVDSIAKSTGLDPSEITDDMELADLGVDSIMAIEVSSLVKTQSGVELPATFVFDYSSVGALREEFGGAAEPAATVEEEPTSSSSSSSGSSGAATPDSTSSLDSDTVKVEKPTEVEQGPTAVTRDVAPTHDTSPQPNVRITLLKGRPGKGKIPLYLMADGTGSIATYIHLPAFKSKMPIYGVDSPFLRCPSRLTPEVGIEGVSRYIVDALIKAEPTGNFYIGGFSAGSIVAYEVARQLPARERKVDGLMLIDLCCPRPATGVQLTEEEVNFETDTGIKIFSNAAAADGMWTSTGLTREHLRAYLVAMRLYHPAPMKADERPGRTAVIWAEKGLVNRVKDDPQSMKLLGEAKIPTTPYPGFMEDPKLGPFACLVPDKSEADLGPNGWDRYVGDTLCTSMDCDHLDMPMPGHVHLLADNFEKILAHFQS